MIPEKQKILIVDDSEMNRAILTGILDDGYDFLEAENGLQALDVLRAHRDISLVLLDIVMPELDGFACCPSWASSTGSTKPRSL